MALQGAAGCTCSEPELRAIVVAKELNDANAVKRYRAGLVADLGLSAVQVELSGLLKVCRDPDDDKLLEIAIVGRADCLVTGDQDLPVLDPFHGVPILTPAGFLATISPSVDPAD